MTKSSTEGKGIKEHQKQFELVDKAMPYLMELSDICLETMGSMTINVNGGHFKYVPDRPQPDDVPIFEHKTINTPTKPTRVYKYKRITVANFINKTLNSPLGNNIACDLLSTMDKKGSGDLPNTKNKAGNFLSEEISVASPTTPKVRPTKIIRLGVDTVIRPFDRIVPQNEVNNTLIDKLNQVIDVVNSLLEK